MKNYERIIWLLIGLATISILLLTLGCHKQPDPPKPIVHECPKGSSWQTYDGVGACVVGRVTGDCGGGCPIGYNDKNTINIK
jgi:hypothetical protein